LRIGDWRVDPLLGESARAGDSVRLEARSMRLLMYLATRAGEVVSIDDLLEHVWTGVIVTTDSVYQAVTSLRRSLGDDAKNPAYIATVPRLGYRMVAPVETWREPAGDAPRARASLRWRRFSVAVATLVAVAGAAASISYAPGGDTRADASATRSVAVMPFLDLTSQAVNEEYFADGMTEELIDHLGTLPDMHVPGATASFHYKGLSPPVADVARELGVAFVLDGSVRKSDDTFRVAARLLRASDGRVVWTHSYDRPLGNVLAIQNDLAGEITRSLQAQWALAAANHTR